MRIAYNQIAANVCRNSCIVKEKTAKHVEALSSGYRINRAADDAAGLCISNKMRVQVRGLFQASFNAQDGIALMDTADGGMNEIHAMLQRMREISVQALNDTNTEEDRNSLDEEVQNLIQEIDRIAVETEFNTRKLLNGSAAGGSGLENSRIVAEQDTAASSLTFTFNIEACKEGVSFIIDGMEFQFTEHASEDNQIQIGSTNEETADNIVAATYYAVTDKYADLGYFADIMCCHMSGKMYDLDLLVFDYPDELTFEYKDASNSSGLHLQIGANSQQSIELGIDDVRAESLGIADANVLDYANAQSTLEKADAAIEKVSKARISLGVMRNRIEHAICYIDTASENLEETESKITDADIGKEMMEYAKNNILVQASNTLLVHANQFPQNVFYLLK